MAQESRKHNWYYALAFYSNIAMVAAIIAALVGWEAIFRVQLYHLWMLVAILLAVVGFVVLSRWLAHLSEEEGLQKWSRWISRVLMTVAIFFFLLYPGMSGFYAYAKDAVTEGLAMTDVRVISKSGIEIEPMDENVDLQPVQRMYEQVHGWENFTVIEGRCENGGAWHGKRLLVLFRYNAYLPPIDVSILALDGQAFLTDGQEDISRLHVPVKEILAAGKDWQDWGR
jgi:hypothetical protein